MKLKDKIQQIIDNVPEGLSDIETARYAYLELGKILNFSTRYHYSLEPTIKSDLFLQPNLDLESEIPVDVVCSSASFLLNEILKKLNLNSFTHSYVDVQHVDVILTTKEGKIYLLNLSNDLHNIQIGSKTRKFASPFKYIDEFYRAELMYQQIKLDSLSEEELLEMDNKLGYTYNGIYMNDFFNRLKLEFMSPSNNEFLKDYVFPKDFDSEFMTEDMKKSLLLKYKFEFLINNANILNDSNSNVGYQERYSYYNKLFNHVFSNKEKFNISYYNCSLNHKTENDDMISVIALTLYSSINYYIFSKEENKFVPIGKKDLQKKLHSSQSFGLREYNIIRGLNDDTPEAGTDNPEIGDDNQR